MKQVHVIFSGFVQGVGFRYTTFLLAGDYKITGWVRNLPDGCVELKAEGDEGNLEKMLDVLLDKYDDSIISNLVSWQEASGGYKEFEIRY